MDIYSGQTKRRGYTEAAGSMSASGPKVATAPALDATESLSGHDSILSVARSFAVCMQHSLTIHDHKHEPHLVKMYK